MVRKHSLYQFATVVWFLLAAGGVIAILIGEAEPYIAPTDIPGGEVGAFGLIVGLVVAGLLVISALERRTWKKAGKAAGLEPESGLHLFGRPRMTGTVRGRPVRVDSYKVSNSSGEGNSSTTYTLVEAKLDHPERRGFFFGRNVGSNHVTEDIPDQVGTHQVGGEFVVMGAPSPEVARDLPTPQVRTAFEDGGSADLVIVGDPTDTIMSVVPDTGGGLAGAVTGMVESKFREAEGFEANTVAHTRKGLILDAEQMERQTEAVAAVANAYELAVDRQQ